MATAKKSAFVLNMPSFEELEDEVMTRYGLVSEHNVLTKRDQRLEAELKTQVRGMSGYKMKSLVVSHSLTKLHKHVVSDVVATAVHHAAIVKEHQGKKYSEFIDEYCFYDLQLLGEQLSKTEIVAEYLLHGEQRRELDLSEPEPEVEIRYVRPDPPKSLWQRLFGG